MFRGVKPVFGITSSFSPVNICAEMCIALGCCNPWVSKHTICFIPVLGTYFIFKEFSSNKKIVFSGTNSSKKYKNKLDLKIYKNYSINYCQRTTIFNHYIMLLKLIFFIFRGSTIAHKQTKFPSQCSWCPRNGLCPQRGFITLYYTRHESQFCWRFCCRVVNMKKRHRSTSSCCCCCCCAPRFKFK